MRSFLKQNRFKHSGPLFNSLKTLHAILAKHWKSICQVLYWRNNMNVSHTSRIDHMQIGTIFKAIFAKDLIKSKCLVSPGQSIQQYEWRFMPVNMNVVYLS